MRESVVSELNVIMPADANTKLPAVVVVPLDVKLNFDTPSKHASINLPENPLGALTPSIVPDVLQAVLVVPAVSMSTSGFVVVVVPPVIGVPVRLNAGSLRAPFVAMTTLPAATSNALKSAAAVSVGAT